MMKQIILIIGVCLLSNKLFSQDSAGMLTEEKSSAWIRITAPVAAVIRNTPRPATTTPRRPTPEPQTRPASTEAFNKTNNQVKRFKKTKTG